MADEIVKFKAADSNVVHELTRKQLKLAAVYKDMADDTEAVEGAYPLSADMASEFTLRIIAHWLKKRDGDEAIDEIKPPLPSADMQECGLEPWEESIFQKIKNDDLVALSTAADKAGCDRLRNRVLVAIACLIRGKKPEEITAEKKQRDEELKNVDPLEADDKKEDD